jgi:hypothetical protein
MDRCPHNPSADEAGSTGLSAWVLAGRTVGLAGLEAAGAPADLPLKLASRIARSAASLLIESSPDEL